MSNCDYVAPQEELFRWHELAVCSFYLRHPDAIESSARELLSAPSSEMKEFLRWGQELAILEHDLTECINEFILSSGHLYKEREELPIKKFAVLYHLDNFNVRIHKFVDNVLKLLWTLVGLNTSERPKRPEAFRRAKECLGKLGFSATLRAVQSLEENRRVSSSVNARHLFVHSYREHPVGEKWKIFDPELRLNEVFESEDEDAQEIRCVTTTSQILGFAQKKVAELKATLGDIQCFRDVLLESLAGELVRRTKHSGKPISNPFVNWIQCYLDLVSEVPPLGKGGGGDFGGTEPC
jgi:hypothetical protein